VRDDGSDARVFRRLADGAVTNANILVRTSRPAVTIVEPLRALVLRLSGDRAFTRVSTFRESGVGTLTRLTGLALIVAALVLSLAAIGLYGSISFMTSQRTREVAIRLALGSPRRAVLRLLARDGVLVVAGGSVLGLALTAIAFQFMSGMIFARWTLDPITVTGVLAAFSVTTLGATYLPGRRAVRIDPMQVLRSE
jgi:putative ABC transport system permease protein